MTPPDNEKPVVEPKLPRGPAQIYLRYMLGFGVSMVAGLSPLLGYRLRGFQAILDIYPLNVRDLIVPFAAFLMALVSVAVQYFAMENVSSVHLRRWFKKAFATVAGMAVLLFILFTIIVIDKSWPAKATTVRYVVGYSLDPNSACAKAGKTIRQCIGTTITYDPEDVDESYPPWQIGLNKLLISLPYLAMMSAFGAMIGMLVIRELKEKKRKAEEQKPPTPRPPRARPRR